MPIPGACRDKECKCCNAWQFAWSSHDAEIEQSLGKVLGYPWYKDDQKNFPGATEADGVCVGEHVAETIAEEAANRIRVLEGASGKFLQREPHCFRGNQPGDKWHHSPQCIERNEGEIEHDC